MFRKNFSRQFSPGIIMASLCVGSSHIIASTQAGAYYGYQLVFFILLVNLLEYLLFRIAFDYSSVNNRILLEGYAGKGRLYLYLFLVFNFFATIINIAGGTLLSAVLLGMLLPFNLPLNILNAATLASFLILLFSRQYQSLDKISKWIMFGLSIITLLALLMAFNKGTAAPTPDSTVMSSWTITAIPFFAALMGWMPAPMELSVSSSMWVIEKNKLNPDYRPKRMIDFNTSYILTIVLALMFMALGALVQYGETTTPSSGGKLIGQFVDMYTHSIGEWAHLPIIFVAFACTYYTTIVAVDGYSRCNMQAVDLLLKKPLGHGRTKLRYWLFGACILSFVLTQFFNSTIGKMIPFAMTASFLSAPVFAWPNLNSAKQYAFKPLWLIPLAWLGWISLIITAIIYLIWVRINHIKLATEVLIMVFHKNFNGRFFKRGHLEKFAQDWEYPANFQTASIYQTLWFKQYPEPA